MNTLLSFNSTALKDNNVTNPLYQSRFHKLEHAVSVLFEKEAKSKNSIFLSYKPEVIKRIALFLSGIASRPAAIGVCGETASGKSTIVMDSMDTIEHFTQEFLMKNVITRINTDDYYYDRSKEVEAAGSFSNFAKNYDFDVPQAIELSLMKTHIETLLQNKAVYLPTYDMSGTAKRFDNKVLATPSPVIISEGLFALTDEIVDIFDFKIYVDIDRDVQRARFFERANQRGLGAAADGIYKNASKKAQVYIHPCKQNSDIVLDGKVSRDRYRGFINALLIVVEEMYCNFPSISG